jgi:hypothetical protein
MAARSALTALLDGSKTHRETHPACPVNLEHTRYQQAGRRVRSVPGAHPPAQADNPVMLCASPVFRVPTPTSQVHMPARPVQLDHTRLPSSRWPASPAPGGPMQKGRGPARVLTAQQEHTPTLLQHLRAQRALLDSTQQPMGHWRALPVPAAHMQTGIPQQPVFSVLQARIPT